MDVSLESLLAIIIEANGGAVEITREQVMNTDFDGRVISVAPSLERNSIILTLEREEDLHEYYQSEEADRDGDSADQGQ